MQMRLRPTALLYNKIISPPRPCLLTSRLRILPLHFEFGIPLRAFAPHRSLHTALWPPLVFANILLALWAYKVRFVFSDNRRMRLNFGWAQCMMLIILQNKLIYLPYIPSGARQETIEQYRPQLLGLDWTTTEVRTRDSKKLLACVAEIRFQLPSFPPPN